MPEVDVSDDMVDVFVNNFTESCGTRRLEEFCARAPAVPNIDSRSWHVDTPHMVSELARLPAKSHMVSA